MGVQFKGNIVRRSTSQSKSEYTVDNNIEFINNIKLEKVPTSHSFNMKSLFTNFLLDEYSQHNTQEGL